MTLNRRTAQEPAQTPDGRDSFGPARPMRSPGRALAARMLASVGFVCLLLAGCHGTLEAIPQPADGSRLFPIRLPLKSDKGSLEEAVQNDPFPAATQVGLQR